MPTRESKQTQGRQVQRNNVFTPEEEELRDATSTLEGQEQKDTTQARDPTPATGPTKTVCLLKATRVPARYRKMVKIKIDGDFGGPLMLFEPTPGRIHSLPDAVLDDSQGKEPILVLQNMEYTPLYLPAGTVLGTVTPAEEVTTTEPQPPFPNETSVCALDSSQESPSRRRSLLEQLGLALEHLTAEEQKELTDLIVSYSDTFALDSGELGSTTLAEHVIRTGDQQPIKQPPRRIPFALRSRVDTLIAEMLAQRVIVPSSSPWASPIVLVKKKDGEMRFCVDYRKLNRATRLDEFPLPRIDDTLDQLAGARYFTTLDLASGYWQVPVERSSQEKTAFITHAGLYHFEKMPFGLVNAPATFQRLMEAVLTGIARDGCHVYLDDVLVFGKTLQEHNCHLKDVLDRIKIAGLKLKAKKCCFAQTSVEYLGHIVSKEGVQTDPKKIRAMVEYPTPVDLKELRSFVGLASYYRRFVPGFANVARPLHALTKKDTEFIWGKDCEEAFQKLKTLLSSAPILQFPNFNAPFILETDASGTGLGAVLAQRHADGLVHPVAYASRSLQPHEKNYGVTELEGLGVVWAVKHFRPYLYGQKCIVYTDHQALKALLNTPQPSGKLARWGMVLQDLDLTIEYRPGRSNANADALSRYPLLTTEDENQTSEVVAAIQAENRIPMESNTLPELQRADEELAPIIRYLEDSSLPEDDAIARRIVLASPRYVIEDHVLYRVEDDSTLRVVPPSNHRRRLFDEIHAGAFGAHLGDVKVHSVLRRHYWWSGMRSDVTKWTRSCLTCATHSPGRKYKPPLTPIPVAGAFDRIGIDVLQLPRTKQGNRYAVVVVDYLTKWPEVFATADQSSATIAKVLVEGVMSRHGVPGEVLSDRGKSFLSGLMEEVEALLGYKKMNTTAYHPQTDGLVERYNRTLLSMLAKVVKKGGPDWDEMLPYVLFAYRSSQQSSTRESPFYLLYGRDPRLPVPAALTPKKTPTTIDLKEYGLELHSRLASAWALARKAVSKTQKRQKTSYDRGVKQSPFREGDRVFLHKPAEQTGEARKLARPFHGPYRLLEVGLNTAKITPVNHPEEQPLLVSLTRLRRCPAEIPDGEFWPSTRRRPRVRGKGKQKGSEAAAGVSLDAQGSGARTIDTDHTQREREASPMVGEEAEDREIPEDVETGETEIDPALRQMTLATGPEETQGSTLEGTVRNSTDLDEAEGRVKGGCDHPIPAEEEEATTSTQLSRRGQGRWAGRLRSGPKKRHLDEDV